MKKFILLLFLGVSAVTFEVAAQTNPTPPVTAIAPVDTLVLKEYVGKYKMKEAAFEEVIVTLQNGKLIGEAVGQGSAELAPTKDANIYEVLGYGGTVEFVRNESRMVVKLKLTVQGTTMEGEKQP